MQRSYTGALVAAVLAACTSVRAAQVSVTWAPPGNENDWTDSVAWGMASGYPDNDHPSGTTYAVTLNGTTTINGISPTIDSLIFRGTLTGSGGLTVNGVLTWTGGQLGLAEGIIVCGGTIQPEYAYANTLDGSLTNAAGGTLTLAQEGALPILELQSGAMLINNGTTVLQAGSVTLSGDAIASAASFINNGTLVVQGINGPSVALTNANDGGYGTFQNNGAVDVQSGTFEVAVNSSAASGSFNVAAGATLELDHAYTFDSGAQLTGTGTVSIDTGIFHGPVNFAGTLEANSLEFDDQATVANLLMPIGTVSGTGSLTVTGTTKLENFTSTIHSLTFDTPSWMTPPLEGATFDGTAAVIASGATVTMEWITVLKNHATFTNNGLLTGSNPIFEGVGTIPGASGTFTNNGVVRASAFEVSSFITFNNNGTLILGNQSVIAGPGTDSANSYIHNANGLLILEATHPFLAGTLQTDGFVQVSLPTGSSTTLGSALTFIHTGTLDVQGGTLVLAAPQNPATTGIFQIDAAGTLEFAASYDFSTTPTLTGSGTLIVDPGVTLTVPADVDFTGTIDVNGTLVIAPPRDPTANPVSPTFTVIGNTVPEPASLTMLGLGAAFLVAPVRGRRRRRD